LKRAVLLLIGTSVIATSAHAQFFRRGPSDEQLRQMQQMQGQGMYIPTPEESKQMQRDAAEMQRLLPEIQRLQRLGRFEEAQVLSKRMDELMSSGPTARMLGQQRGQMGEAMRALPPGTLPEGMTEEALDNATRFSTSDAIGMEQRMLEGDGAYLPEPLFVKPALLRFSADMMATSANLPMPARRLMIDGYGLMVAKDYDGADAAFRQAAALTPSPVIVEARSRLEVVRGNPMAALRLLAAAKQSISILWEQSYVHSTMGQHGTAIEAAERALKIAAADPKSIEYASALNNIGVALYEADAAQRALEYYERAITALHAAVEGATQFEAPMFRTQIPLVAANLGLAFWRSGDLTRAAGAFRIALEERAYYENAGDVFMTERAQMAKAQAVAVELHALMSLDPKNLGLQTLLERKGALLERRTRVQTAFRRDASTEVEQPNVFGRMFESPLTRVQREQQMSQRAENQELLREYEAVVAERAALPRNPSNARRIQQLDNQIQVMQQRMSMHEQQSRMQAETPNLDQREMERIARAAGNDPQKMTDAINKRMDQQQQQREQGARESRATLLARVQERVPPGAVLLEMVKYRPVDPRTPAARPERYGTYLIRADAAPEYIDLGEAAPLEKLIGDFRLALSTPERPTRDLARRLDETLMRPVRAKLAGATTLYVAPEGALNLVPLSALIDEQGKYLLERYTINYLASGRDLLHLGRAEAARSPTLIIADPAFDGSVVPAQAGTQTGAQSAFRSRDFRSTKYARLPGTATEAQTLKQVLPDAVVVTGTAATETATKKITGPRILHIATHGFFLDDLPGESEDPMLRSGLVFAGVNTLSSGSDDGVLTALEASNLDLRGTKLVVLSACETGLGEVRNGEGVFGLRRAFVVAGAETLLMSLWQVADEATKDLMTSYYSRLSKGEQRAEALRQAQLVMIKDEKTRHPFFWAAFISSGESGALK
jgi:CHAT domain-containing protein/tetratricopeptide (TPR) repeat protein